MAQQEEGWPLGLRPLRLNARIGLVGNQDHSGSVSFTTLLTASPTSSTDSSSDLDTQSTGSFFHDKSRTLGRLIGISSIVDLSRRSIRGRTVEISTEKKQHKSKLWLFSLCSKLCTDAVSSNNTQSLGHFLEAERRAANAYRRNNIEDPPANGASVSAQNLVTERGRRSNTEILEHGNGYGIPLFLPCLCGQLIQ